MVPELSSWEGSLSLQCVLSGSSPHLHQYLEQYLFKCGFSRNAFLAGNFNFENHTIRLHFFQSSGKLTEGAKKAQTVNSKYSSTSRSFTAALTKHPGLISFCEEKPFKKRPFWYFLKYIGGCVCV